MTKSEELKLRDLIKQLSLGGYTVSATFSKHDNDIFMRYHPDEIEVTFNGVESLEHYIITLLSRTNIL